MRNMKNEDLPVKTNTNDQGEGQRCLCHHLRHDDDDDNCFITVISSQLIRRQLLLLACIAIRLSIVTETNLLHLLEFYYSLSLRLMLC